MNLVATVFAAIISVALAIWLISLIPFLAPYASVLIVIVVIAAAIYVLRSAGLF